MQSRTSGLFWTEKELTDQKYIRKLIQLELAKYNIDIAAPCETRFSESGSLIDLEYSFFWIGKPEVERRMAGAGLATRNDSVTKLTEITRPVSDIIMTRRRPLSKGNLATIISVYAPTMTNPDENKEAFYNQLASVFSNSYGERLLALCSEFERIMTNTMLMQKDERKTTWMHPRSGHWHMIDFIVTR